MVSIAPGHPAATQAAIGRRVPLPWSRCIFAAAVALIGTAFVASGRSFAVLAVALPCLALALATSASGVAALPRRGAAPRPVMVGPSTVTTAMIRHGHTHINSYAAAPDKRAVELASGGVVAYRVANRVAVTAGDPLDDPLTQARAIREFVALRRAGGWLPCFFQIDPSLRSAYRASGMRLVKFGEEAIVDLCDFTLATPARANLRREVGRARRAGLTATVLPWSAIDPALVEELRDVSRTWLSGRGTELGFSMGRLGETVDHGAWLTVVRDSEGAVHAFSSWLRMRKDGLALDMVRRRPHAGPGAVDLCLADTLRQAQARGLRRASLGSVPFRDSLGDAPDGRVTRWIRRRLHCSRLHGYCYGSLGAFKQKFAPQWESRDVAFPHWAAIPVLLALMRVHMARNVK